MPAFQYLDGPLSLFVHRLTESVLQNRRFRKNEETSRSYSLFRIGDDGLRSFWEWANICGSLRPRIEQAGLLAHDLERLVHHRNARVEEGLAPPEHQHLPLGRLDGADAIRWITFRETRK